MASEHDRRYKKLFSHPGFMERLLSSFVDEDFVKDLDFSTLKRIDKSFVSDDFREKESDIIYTVKYKNHTLYTFLLLEFQSTVDKLMPIRFVRYITELYENYKSKTTSGKLPAVFPILLYNGENRWIAPLRFEECVEKTIPADYIPRFKYFPILINEIPKESLVRIKNALSAVFYIENSSTEEIEKNLDDFFNLIQEENLEVLNLLGFWFKNYLESLDMHEGKSIGESMGREIGKKFDSIMEVKNMFATKTKEMGKKYFEKGIEKGLKETAFRMLEEGFEEEIVCKITGLSKDTLRELKKK